MSSSQNTEPPVYRPSGPAPEFTEEDAADLWDIPTYTPKAVQLPLPLCTPQLTGKFDAPFARGYSAQLEGVDIAMEEWLKFVDGLNVAITASPPLRVVNAVGVVIGMVPYHWAMIAGTVLQTSAQVATHVISKKLTDRYLRRANKLFFAPRGLRVRLCKTAAMRQLIGLDAIPSKPPSKAGKVAKGIGRGVENVLLALPLPQGAHIVEQVHWVSDHITGNTNGPPKVDAWSPMNVTERRMAQLDGYVLPMDFRSVGAVPPPARQETAMGRMNDLAVKLDRALANNKQAGADRARRLLLIARGEEAPEAPAAGKWDFVKPWKVLQKVEEMSVRQEAYRNQDGGFGGRRFGLGGGLGGGRLGSGYGAGMSQGGSMGRGGGFGGEFGGLAGVRGSGGGFHTRKLELKVAAADRLEFNLTDALLWIVVLNAEQDELIEGTHHADEAADEEVVDDVEWNRALEMEDQEEYLRAEPDMVHMSAD